MQSYKKGINESNLKIVGHWNIPDQDIYIDPQTLMNKVSWEEHEKNLILSYLENGYVFEAYCGCSYDRINPSTPDEIMGSTVLTDGYWAWPFGLAHYVRNYNIDLPHAFLETMRYNNYNVVMYNEIDNYLDQPDTYFVTSTDFWKEWCTARKEQLANE